MKALSIKQPFAELILTGMKDREHRSRKTNYRGEIVIHSSLKPDKEFMDEWGFNEHKFMNGYLLGKVEIYDCKQVGPERYAWLVRHPVMFKKIIPARGNLGLWPVDLEDVETIERMEADPDD